MMLYSVIYSVIIRFSHFRINIQIHEVVIGPLEHSTTYYYWFGGSSPEYSFKTPPVRLLIKFFVVGDLGRTPWTEINLKHIENSNYDVLQSPGDLLFADCAQRFWDSFGRLVEPLASKRPWMVTEGDHEIEIYPLINYKRFVAYNARWRMPFEESLSTSNLYYSFEVSKVHVIMLGSYADFGPGSDQFKWIEHDLSKVNRTTTPWLVVVVHAPWYNSNFAHQGEKESVGMRKSMEELLYNARVDIVFARQVLAYERFNSVYKQKEALCGPVHTTIGDGG
ncbi:putative Acid phosphatase [Helianthus debilis subsp. tardiflorus]